MNDRTNEKICSLDELASRASTYRAEGERVVLCHGCFDIVHPGHVRHLQHAAQHGDHLFVSITADGEVGKGEGRPLIPQFLRAENLAALSCVDAVTINPHPTAVEVLASVRPDIYVKGREYEQNNDPRFRAEQATVESFGGRVLFTSGDVVFSSTALIESMGSIGHLGGTDLGDRFGLDETVVERTMARWADVPVVVVGESILDMYVHCDHPDVSDESPMMTLRPMGEETFDGGAAVVARHLVGLGARPVLVTALPETDAAEQFRVRLEANGVRVRSVQVEHPLITKKRFLVGRNKMFKIDIGGATVLDSYQNDALVSRAAAEAQDSAIAIIADYGVGMFSPGLLQRLCGVLRPEVEVLAGDVSGRLSNLLSFRDADLLCPSESEMRRALGDQQSSLATVAWRMMEQTSTSASIVTMGPNGLTAFQQSNRAKNGGSPSRLSAEHIPALAAHAVDQLGCGDALLSAAALTLWSSGSMTMSALFAAAAAKVQAMRLGNHAITADDLRETFRQISRTRSRTSTDAAFVR